MLLGENEKAKAQFLTVKEAGPPPMCAQNIDRYLALINTATPKTWKVWGSAGVLYDTNVNAGPGIDTVTMFGLPFTLSSTAKPQADKALVINLGFDQVRPISENVAWQTAVSLKGTEYSRVHALDSLYGYASTGLLWKQSPSLIWSLPVFVDGTTFRNGNAWYAMSYGVNPQVRYTFNPLVELSFGGTVAVRDYQSPNRDNVLAWALTPGVGYKLGPATIVRFGASYGREDTPQSAFANTSRSGNVNLTHAFAPTLSLTAFGRYSDNLRTGSRSAAEPRR